MTHANHDYESALGLGRHTGDVDCHSLLDAKRDSVNRTMWPVIALQRGLTIGRVPKYI